MESGVKVEPTQVGPRMEVCTGVLSETTYINDDFVNYASDIKKRKESN
jgi:hypothetical protein